MSIRLRGTLDQPAGPLFDLYERYVGEPRTRKDVYGYATFILGYVFALLGVVAYLLGAGGPTPDFGIREISISMAATGLALSMFGVGLRLPVRRRGIQASLVGLAVALVSVVAFVNVYPSQWTGPNDASGTVITAYTAGLAIVAGVAVMVPVLTGEKGLLVSEIEEGREHPPVMVGDATRGALFALYQVGTGEWTWRVLSQEALGENASDPYARPEIEAAVEGLRSTLNDARLLEITTAAFRLYETTDGQWRWTLMREDGSVVARSGETYPERSATGEATSLLKELGPAAPLLDVRGAAFDCYLEDGRWRWRLLDESRAPLAVGSDTYADRDAAEDAIETAKERFADAPLLSLDALGAELFEEAGEWRWRLVDDADDVLAVSVEGFGSRRAAESAANAALAAVADATLMEAGVPGFELFRSDGTWRFRLVDEDGEVAARSHGFYGDEAEAGESADWMAATVVESDVIQYDEGSFEVYPAGEAWRWRLVTEDREVVAASTEHHESIEEAEAAVRAVRDRASVADLIEFEQAAFQQYESDGRWRWRLIDEDGNVMADSGEDYATRDEVGDAMTTLKKHAPTAEILEIEAAAFELFQDEAGSWGWRLIDEAGAMVAQGASRHPSRAAAQEAMDFLVARSTDAEVRPMERAAFQFYTDGEEAWRWRYLHPEGHAVAESGRSYSTRDRLVGAVSSIREMASTAERRTLDPLGVELLPRGSGWRFRILDADREPVAEAASSYETRDAAAAVVRTVQENAADATVFAIDDGAVRVVATGDGYRWELVGGDRSPLAVGPSSYEDSGLAAVAADKASTLAPESSVVEFESAAFQVHQDDGAWGWQLVDENGASIASGSPEHATRDDASEAVSAVRSLLDAASVLEIDDAAFELHRRPDGWTWRLVDENGSPIVRSVEAYGSRADARASLTTVKEHGPEGWVSVVD